MRNRLLVLSVGTSLVAAAIAGTAGAATASAGQATRLAAQPPVSSNTLTTVSANPTGAIHQFIVLTQRYVSVAFQDYKNIITGGGPFVLVSLT